MLEQIVRVAENLYFKYACDPFEEENIENLENINTRKKFLWVGLKLGKLMAEGVYGGYAYK